MRIMRRAVLCLALAAIGASLYGQPSTLPLQSGSVRFAAIGDMGTGKTAQYELAETMDESRRAFAPQGVMAISPSRWVFRTS